MEKQINKGYLSKSVSIVIPTYNASDSIDTCIKSLINQTYKNIEIIFSDDCSTDDTVKKIKSYRDKRIRVLTSDINKGPSNARNNGINNSNGELIFFIDDDEKVQNTWIEKSIKYFLDDRVVGIEGKIIYVSKSYKPRFSDNIRENQIGKLYQTGNAAYRKELLIKCGLFDLSLRKFQDRDLALKVLKYGEILYTTDNPAVHKREVYTVQSYMKEANKVKYWAEFYKIHRDKTIVFGFIYEPFKLIGIIFPPIILARLFQTRLKSKKDFLFFVLIYPRLVYERLILWQWAIKNKVFLI